MAQQRNPYMSQSTEGTGWWTPDSPEYDPGSGGYNYPPPPTLAPAQQPAPPVTAAPPPVYDYAKLNAFRDARSAAGQRTDETDLNVFNSADFKNWNMGDTIAPTQAQSAGQGGPVSNPFNDQLKSALLGLFGGGRNEDIINRRTDIARDTLERQRKSRMASNESALASRGLIGDGPQISAQNRLDNDIADRFANAYSGIVADESGKADQRLLQALGISAGISGNELDNMVNMFRAQTERTRAGNDFTLGQGQLAIGNMSAVNDYNLGLGRLGLDRDRLLAEIDNMDLNQIITLLEQLYNGAQTSAGGYRIR